MSRKHLILPPQSKRALREERLLREEGEEAGCVSYRALPLEWETVVLPPEGESGGLASDCRAQLPTQSFYSPTAIKERSRASVRLTGLARNETPDCSIRYRVWRDYARRRDSWCKNFQRTSTSRL